MGPMAWATHLVGGSMYYEHLGGDQYEVFLVIYRDCGPTNTNGTGFDLAANIAAYQGTTLASQVQAPITGDVEQIDLQSGNPCAQLPPGVCVERAVYSTILTLPASTEPYTIVFQRCCRNPQVINLVDPTNTGFTIFVEVPPALGNGDIDLTSNSSPKFENLPQGYVCVNQPFSLVNPAQDLDGDSLSFSISNVFIGGSFSAPTPNPPAPPPYDNVTWADGYAPQTPLGNSPEDWIQIDPQTGTLTGTPTTIGKYVIGIFINESRQDDNGNWINLGKVFRDFTIDVVPCELVFPEVQWPEPCTGLDVNFGVGANTGSFAWDFGTGAASDTSSLTTPSFNFPAQGNYTVSLAYDLGGCGDSISQSILVAPPVEASFVLGEPNCFAAGWGQPVEYTGDLLGESGSLTWLVDGEEVASSTAPGTLPIPPGDHTVSTELVNDIGCQATSQVDLELPNLPTAAFETSEPPCNGLEIGFNNLSINATSQQWTFDLNDPSTEQGPENTTGPSAWTYSDFGSYVAQLIAQPGEACADTASILIEVLPQDPLVLAFGAVEPLACSLETTVEFTFNGAFADAVNWDFGSAGSASGDTVAFDFGGSGLYPVTLTIVNDTCATSQSADFEVYVPELVAEVELVIPNVITPNADGKNDRFRIGTKRTDGNGVDVTNSSSFSYFKLQVFDRWGVQVHESEGVGAGWDGRIGGNVAAPGVYYFILNADHSCLDNDIEEVGQVTLILD